MGLVPPGFPYRQCADSCCKQTPLVRQRLTYQLCTRTVSNIEGTMMVCRIAKSTEKSILLRVHCTLLTVATAAHGLQCTRQTTETLSLGTSSELLACISRSGNFYCTSYIAPISAVPKSKECDGAQNAVVKRVGDVAYELSLLAIKSRMHPVFLVSLLRKHQDGASGWVYVKLHHLLQCCLMVKKNVKFSKCWLIGKGQMANSRSISLYSLCHGKAWGLRTMSCFLSLS